MRPLRQQARTLLRQELVQQEEMGLRRRGAGGGRRAWRRLRRHAWSSCCPGSATGGKTILEMCKILAIRSLRKHPRQQRRGGGGGHGAGGGGAGGERELFGVGGKDSDNASAKSGVGKQESNSMGMEPDGWLTAVALSLQAALTNSAEGSARRCLAQRLLAALVPPIVDNVIAGPPPMEQQQQQQQQQLQLGDRDSLPHAERDARAERDVLHQRVCTQCVRLVVLCHKLAPPLAKPQVETFLRTSLLALHDYCIPSVLILLHLWRLAPTVLHVPVGRRASVHMVGSVVFSWGSFFFCDFTPPANLLHRCLER
jgi:hypothetical protein